MSDDIRSGISNRESSVEEAEERDQHPSLAQGEEMTAFLDEPAEDTRDEQTSHKSGSRSTAQKAAGSRYPEAPMPSSNKVPGAFGREPDE